MKDLPIIPQKIIAALTRQIKGGKEK